MEKLREETITCMRSCLMSVKGQLDIRELDRDYCSLMGYKIPYQKLGHQTLESFLRSIPSLNIWKAPSGQVFIDPKSTPLTKSITNMIGKQKSSNKKKKTTKPIRPITQNFSQFKYPQRMHPRILMNYNYPPNRAYESLPRFLHHNQFVSTPPRRLPPPQPYHLNNNNYNCANNNAVDRSKTPVSQHNKENVNNPATAKKLNGSSPVKPPSPPTLKPESTPARSPALPNVNHRVFDSTNVEQVSQDKLTRSEKTNRSMILTRMNSSNSAESPKNENGNRLSWSSGVSSASDETIKRKDIFVMSGDASKDLWNYTRFRRLSEPDVSVHTRKMKTGPVQYDCKVKVDGIVHSSYPKDFTDRQAATVYASQVALSKLLEKYGWSRNPAPKLISTEKHVHERIPSLVQKHFNGVWSWQVEADYKNLYDEALPTEWLTMVDKIPFIAVEQFGTKYVLRFCNPEDKLQKGKPVPVLACDVSIPTSSARFNDEGFLTAKVTCPVFAGEIWCRQIYTEETATFEKMAEKMDKFYSEQFASGKTAAAENVIKGHYYTAFNDGNWYRVRIIDNAENGYQCLFVDRGDDLIVPKENIYNLLMEYAREPAQAFICRLAGLEDLYEISTECDTIMELEGIDVTLEAVESTVENGDKCENKILTVGMYDSDGSWLNDEIRNNIWLEIAKPILEINTPIDVHVSHIGTKGAFYVQVRTAGYTKLMTLLREMEADLLSQIKTLNITHKITRANSEGKLFYAKVNDDTQHYRVKIIDSPPTFQFAQLLYVDYGKTVVVKMSDVNLYPLELINREVSKFPEQAVLVKLDIEEVPSYYTTKMQEMIPKEDSVLLRVVKITDDNIPLVKLFVRHPNIGLVSVSDSLAMEKYNSESPTPRTNSPTPRTSSPIQQTIPQRFSPSESPNNVPSTGCLPGPRLPQIGEFYEVKVPFAVNPWNFFVQPLDPNGLLPDLMKKMKQNYGQNAIQPIDLSEIKAGSIYAAKYSDNVWYRVCVLKIIYPSAIIVFYVDYGYYANLNYTQLYPLEKEFAQLPYQAIKAKLAGIKPKQEKWSVEDCKYFQSLVQKREYVSVMMSIERDELYPCDKVLLLKLVDTKSSHQDVLIGDMLIQKKIAVRDG